MARYKDEQCRICRREGQKLFLKGSRCYSDKCSISRRNYAPGQHGQRRTKLSEYGTQLREKQKTKAYYGVGEKQFRKYFEMASNKKGVTGENSQNRKQNHYINQDLFSQGHFSRLCFHPFLSLHHFQNLHRLTSGFPDYQVARMSVIPYINILPESSISRSSGICFSSPEKRINVHFSECVA